MASHAHLHISDVFEHNSNKARWLCWRKRRGRDPVLSAVITLSSMPGNDLKYYVSHFFPNGLNKSLNMSVLEIKLVRGPEKSLN